MPTALSPKQWARWERTRQRGKWRFVWLGGVLSAGIPWGFLMGLFLWFSLPHHRSADLAFVFSLAIPGALLFGFFFGVCIWHLNEHKYQERVQFKEDVSAAVRGALKDKQTSVQKEDEFDTRQRFAELAKEWKDQSRFLSNTAQIVLLQPYQRIIGMGPEAVPLILEELQREPNQWFWALEAITGQNPVPLEARGKVSEMARSWIEWGRRHELLA
jgi:hypothetical protein